MYPLSYSKRKFSTTSCNLLILISLLTFFFGKAIGQQPAYKLPAVVQPSPQSMAFTRYGDYPMTECNGLTDITVPIHTVVGRKLSLPITMSFHASGRMASESNGILGIRWTLNCGGLVTRTMKGLPDEYNPKTPFNVMQYVGNMSPNFDTLYSACTDGKIQYLPYQDVNNPVSVPLYDSEYDIFSYSLPNGKQGHFILRNENGTKVPMLIPYDPLKIETVKASTYEGYYENIKITDLDGTQYFFGKIDGSTANAVESTWEYDILFGQLGNLPTAWYLTKIISPDGTDQLTLSYTTQSRTVWTGSQTANIDDRLRSNNVNLTGELGDAYSYYLQSNYVQWHFEQDYEPISTSISKPNVPTVASINFDGGSVAFSYSYPQFLTQIVVNRGSTPYKKVTFNCVKHANEGELNYLDDIKFYGEDQVTIGEKYSFTYYEDGEVDIPQFASKCRDWWGYYFPAGLLPYQSVSIAPTGSTSASYSQEVGSGVNRIASTEYYKSLGMLKTITYPTGGKTEFVYEQNQYDWSPYYVGGQNTYVENGPGLRIKEIISTPVQGVPIHKMYKYGYYEDGRGFINECMRPYSYTWWQTMVSEGVTMHFWQGDWAQFFQAGFRSKTYLSDPYINFDLGGSQIKYDAVTEYVEQEGYPRQKTKVRYDWYDNDQLIDFTVHDYEESIIIPRKFANPEDAWKTPEMIGKEFYKYNNGNFDLLRRETYAYEGSGSPGWSEAFDMPTYMHTNVIWARPYNNTELYSAKKNYDAQNCSVYGYGIRRYTTGKRILYSSTVEDFTPSGTITTEKQYEYDDTYNFLVKSEQTTNSKGQEVKTTYTYPPDFPSTTVYQQMVQKNILAPIISQTTTVASSQTKKTITNYVSPFTNGFFPQSIESKNGSGGQHTIANFNLYDSYGNILEQQKVNDVKEVFLWGYGNKYPVAKILGTNYSTAIGYVTQSVLDAPSSDAALRTHLNNLRSIPNTLVTTYTYKPLVGITSETDPKGKTIYYEFDNFNRLKVVRDQDGNILKKMDYQFQVPYNQ